MVQIQNELSFAQRAGRNLDRLLWEKRIKQVDFATMVDRDARTVRRWMYGGIPSLCDLELVVRTLGVSVGDILSEGEGVSFYICGHLMSALGKLVSVLF